MAPITLEKVTKVYPNGFKAVTELNLDVADGEFMVLVGPSGLRQDDGAAHGGRPRGHHRGVLAHRRPRRERRLAEGP